MQLKVGLSKLRVKVMLWFFKYFAKEIACYDGEVVAVCPREEPDGVVVKFTDREGKDFFRVFPRERLDQARASFETAKVQYRIFRLGPMSASTMLYAGPPPEELFNEPFDGLTDEEIADLQELER